MLSCLDLVEPFCPSTTGPQIWLDEPQILWHMQILWYKISWLTGAINLTPWYVTYNSTSPTTPVRSGASPVQRERQNLLCESSLCAQMQP